MENVLQALRAAVAYLTQHGVPEARQSAEMLLAHVLGCRRLDLYGFPEKPLGASERARFRALLRRRARREPVAYILRQAPFYEDLFYVTPAVLVPRPETEHVVEVVRERAPRDLRRILDIGTGSGCLALTLKRFFPEAEVWAVDVSRRALAVARKNGRRLNRRVRWAQADVQSPDFLSAQAPFDLIVSNPPYIPLAERPTLEPELAYEPEEALFCGEDPLFFYRLILGHLPRLLTPAGLVVLEVHADHGPAAQRLFQESGWPAHLERDYGGLSRVLWAYRPLEETKRECPRGGAGAGSGR
ncbi:MAG: peptide chain release factor N(5)-glutamine methyltransferase [Bacteroidetes bacterium]|nr:peptide chain release factor N(5)-glutamine methyltransferase [Rhodothermia bacterium]MCS7154639.1 peptide chain release factor N(5)-glutamine methyltransferase [Bacteroidota bacterium]MCX7906356.1 peptide chain release factor N(5)-glutamine methyltransferase [Bacteroidota bacterium]MDW8285614.1 peptide chain release factor N(5)-glutamine methyltransferase [Bacteroidota bacterium]